MDWIYQDMLQIKIPDDFEDYGQEQLKRVKYESTYTILNMGSLFLIFIFAVIQAILLSCCNPCSLFCGERFKNYHKNAKKALYWNTFIRLFLEACLDISIASFNNLNIVVELTRDGFMDWWQPNTSFFWINYTVTIAAIFTLIFAPPFFVFYYLRTFKKWEDEHFEEKMGALLEGLRKDSRWSLFYPIFFVLRRAIFVFQAIFLPQHFEFQIFLQIIFTLIQLLYLTHFKPFEIALV